jgi:hypothetical protein
MISLRVEAHWTVGESLFLVYKPTRRNCADCVDVERRPAVEQKKLDQRLKIRVKIVPVQPSERRSQLYGQPQPVEVAIRYLGLFPRYTQIAEERQGQKLAEGSAV